MTETPWTKHTYLRRLPPDAYRNYAIIHWSMTINQRKRGWLTEVFHARCREILTHTAFRYGVICPCYTLMPDHLHLFWMGYNESSDQRVGMRFFRKQINWILKPSGFELQKQGHDHVLREESRKPKVFQAVADYVRENPLRAGLVGTYDDLSSYPFSGCIIPGYPEVDVWDEGFWESFWKLYWLLRDDSEK